MSRARTSGDIWWARIFDRLDEFLHNYPKLPKNSVTESSLPLHIGSKVTINNYNTFLHNYGSIDGQVLHYVPRGNGVEVAPDACVSPGVAFVPKPSASAVIPRPPGKSTCTDNVTMTAKLYRQGMLVQRWDFGNIKKHSRDPVNDPPGCNAPNLAAYQITIPISEVFWDPPFNESPYKLKHPEMGLSWRKDLCKI
ncbi:unnamed protein product [Rhizophagus irregularis]|nr:unnamed protein product [Rhizophagus irregularis]